MVQAVAAVAPVRIVRPRRETPQQWNRALARAIEEALDVLTEPQSGRTFVESGAIPGILYEVTEHGCSCKAGENGVPCKHRACLLAQLGILPLDTEPVSMPAVPAVVACLFCRGTGRYPNDYKQCYDTCSVCEGTGVSTRSPRSAAA